MLNSKVFRQEALKHMFERFASDDIEKLEGRLKPPVYTTISICVLIMCWLWIFRLPEIMVVRAMLVYPQQYITSVKTSLEDGVVQEVLVQSGQKVTAGQLLAILSHPIHEKSIYFKHKQLAQLEEEKQRLEALITDPIPTKLRQHIYNNAENTMKHLANKQQLLKHKLATQQRLIAKGLITKEQVEKTELAHNDVLIQLQELQKTTLQLDYDKRIALIDLQTRLSKVMDDIHEARKELSINRKVLNQANYIEAPVAGTIFDLAINQGDTLDKQQHIFSIINNSTLPLELVALLAVEQAARITKGASVYIKTPDIIANRGRPLKGEVIAIDNSSLTTSSLPPQLGFKGIVEELNQSPIVRKVHIRIKAEDSQEVSKLGYGAYLPCELVLNNKNIFESLVGAGR